MLVTKEARHTYGIVVLQQQELKIEAQDAPIVQTQVRAVQLPNTAITDYPENELINALVTLSTSKTSVATLAIIRMILLNTSH